MDRQIAAAPAVMQNMNRSKQKGETLIYRPAFVPTLADDHQPKERDGR